MCIDHQSLRQLQNCFCTRRRPYVVETYVCTYYCNLLCYVKCSTSPLLFKPMSLYHIQSRPSPSRASCCPSPCLGYVHGGPPPSSLLLPLLPPPSPLLPPPSLSAGRRATSQWHGRQWTLLCVPHLGGTGMDSCLLCQSHTPLQAPPPLLGRLHHSHKETGRGEVTNSVSAVHVIEASHPTLFPLLPHSPTPSLPLPPHSCSHLSSGEPEHRSVLFLHQAFQAGGRGGRGGAGWAVHYHGRKGPTVGGAV